MSVQQDPEVRNFSVLYIGRGVLTIWIEWWDQWVLTFTL